MCATDVGGRDAQSVIGYCIRIYSHALDTSKQAYRPIVYNLHSRRTQRCPQTNMFGVVGTNRH